MLSFPGLAIGPGGRPACAARVVGGVDRQVGARQLLLPLADRVLHGRVDVEPHALPEPVVDHAGDQRALPGDGHLALDHRRDDQHVELGQVARLGVAVVDVGGVRLVGLELEVDQVARRRVLRQLVRGREQEPLERRRPPGAGERLPARAGAGQGEVALPGEVGLRLEQRGDLLAPQALADQERGLGAASSAAGAGASSPKDPRARAHPTATTMTRIRPSHRSVRPLPAGGPRPRAGRASRAGGAATAASGCSRGRRQVRLEQDAGREAVEVRARPGLARAPAGLGGRQALVPELHGHVDPRRAGGPRTRRRCGPAPPRSPARVRGSPTTMRSGASAAITASSRRRPAGESTRAIAGAGGRGSRWGR